MSKSVPELATRRPSTKRRHTCAKRTKITKLPIGVTIEEAIKQLFMIGVDGVRLAAHLFTVAVARASAFF